ncbi:MAG TPA: aromatic aminobenezylarsenical efflux permease ArsG family transporter, partial [Thermoanaerobaculia bacterium]|nr:aromatic aminobenezylarsenical efflux permease ArsG family transporter [Thermoanaerobaculia bacterium]
MTWLAAAGGALWLGLLTSISPCPLATNIAAVSYVGRFVGGSRRAIWAAVAYVVGRAIAYAAVAFVVVSGLLSIPGVAMFLQQQGQRWLGPILLLTGLVLLGAIPLRLPGSGRLGRLGERAGRRGLGGALLLGALFALAFCPVSAALFFGSLIPLALAEESRLLLPLLYGVGTGIPVVAIAVPLALGATRVGTALARLE